MLIPTKNSSFELCSVYDANHYNNFASSFIYLILNIYDNGKYKDYTINIVC